MGVSSELQTTWMDLPPVTHFFIKAGHQIFITMNCIGFLTGTPLDCTQTIHQISFSVADIVAYCTHPHAALHAHARGTHDHAVDLPNCNRKTTLPICRTATEKSMDHTGTSSALEPHGRCTSKILTARVGGCQSTGEPSVQLLSGSSPLLGRRSLFEGRGVGSCHLPVTHPNADGEERWGEHEVHASGGGGFPGFGGNSMRTGGEPDAHPLRRTPSCAR